MVKTVFSYLSLLAIVSAVVACGQPAAPSAEVAQAEPDILPVQPTAQPADATGTDPTSSDLPPIVQLLSPEYQEAYRLLPDGPWAQKYFHIQFGYAWEELNDPVWVSVRYAALRDRRE